MTCIHYIVSFVFVCTINKNGSFSSSQDGKIDFMEYVAAVNLVFRGKLEDKLKWSFKVYDRDRNGCLDRQEIRHVVKVRFHFFSSQLKILFPHVSAEYFYRTGVNRKLYNPSGHITVVSDSKLHVHVSCFIFYLLLICSRDTETVAGVSFRNVGQDLLQTHFFVR